MSKKLTRRLLSIMLSLVMLCSLVVSPAYAAGETSDADIQESASIAAADADGIEQLIVEDEATVKEEPETTALDSESALAEAGVDGSSAAAVSDDSGMAVIGDTSYASVAEAVEAVPDDTPTTITLTQSTSEENLIIGESQNITLDLGGYTLTLTGAESATVTNVSGIHVSLLNEGTLTVQNGTISALNSTYTSGGTTYYVSYAVVNQGTFTVGAEATVISRRTVNDAGTYNVSETGYVYGYYYSIMNYLNGAVNISDSANVYAYSYYGIYNASGAVSVSGGTIYGTMGIVSNSGCTTTITGGTVSGSSVGVYATGSGSIISVGTTGGSDSDLTITGQDGIYLTSGASAEVYSGTITGTGDDASAGIVVWGTSSTYTDDEFESATKTSLNISGGAISGDAYGVAGNGSSHYTDIAISGGSITGSWGIYHPQYGSLTIKGGTITGATTGIEIRAGEAEISGDDTVISSDYNPLDYTENGSGTTVAGAALAVSQHTTKLNISVKISDGYFEGFYGVYEANVQGNEFDEDDSYENYVDVEISGGKFYTRYATSLEEYTDSLEAGVTSILYGYAVLGTSSETLKVTGGYFNSNPSKCYVDIESESDYETRDFVADPYYVVTRSDSYTDTDLAADYPFYVTDNRIVAAGIDLASGYFEVNFYVDSKADDYSAIEGLTINESSKSISQTDVNVNVDEDSSYTCDMYTQQVNPQYIATDIIVTLELAEGYAVSQTTTMKDLITGWLTSDYATSLDSDEAAVLIAMLNYGAAAQYNADNTLVASELANYGYAYGASDNVSGFPDSLNTLYASINADYLKDVADYSVGSYDEGYDGPKWSGSVSLVCGSDIDFLIRFSSNITSFYSDDESSMISVDMGNIECNVSVSGNYLIISGLSVQDLAQDITITVKDSENREYHFVVDGLTAVWAYYRSSEGSTQLVFKNLYMNFDAVSSLSEEGKVVLMELFNDPVIEEIYLTDNDSVETSLSDKTDYGDVCVIE